MSHVISLKSRSNSIKGDVGCTLPTSKCWSLGVGAGLEEPKLLKLIPPDWISVIGEIFTRYLCKKKEDTSVIAEAKKKRHQIDKLMAHVWFSRCFESLNSCISTFYVSKKPLGSSPSLAGCSWTMLRSASERGCRDGDGSIRGMRSTLWPGGINTKGNTAVL